MPLGDDHVCVQGSVGLERSEVAASLGDSAQYQVTRAVSGFSYRYQRLADPADALAGAGQPVEGQVIQALHGCLGPP